MSKPTIIHTPKEADRRSFSLERAIPQNKTLSWEARGVLCYLLSQPSDWEVRVDDLKQGCGRDKVYKILAELQTAGHLRRKRTQRADGRYEWGPYTVYELPLPEKADMGLREEEPFPDLPDTDLPDTANQEINTQSLSIQEDSMDKDSASADADAPPLVVVKRINPWYDVILETWKYTGAMNGAMEKMLKGKATDKAWKKGNVTETLEPSDVRDWAAWYRSTALGGDKRLNMLEDRMKIASSIGAWHLAGRPRINQNTITVAPPTQEDIDRDTDSSRFRRYDADGNFAGFGREESA